MPKYEDCISCAFYRVEPAICEQCDSADQWEPADYEYAAYGSCGKKILKMQKRERQQNEYY